MENVQITIDGILKDVYGIFYIYNSKYYFIYTEKELDESGYVVLYMTQVGLAANSEVPNSMVALEITDPEEQKNAQQSISYIVEDKKNNTISGQIQYLPMNMLSNLTVVSKKRFRLLKEVVINDFKLDIPNSEKELLESESENDKNHLNENINDNVIIDYRTKYFEEQDKNKELQAQIDSLTKKIDEIKKIVQPEE